MKSSSRRGGLIYRKGFRNGVTKAMRAYSRRKVGEETRKGHNNPVGPKETEGLQLHDWGWGQVKRARHTLKDGNWGYLHFQEF